jgi:hypothetical protein
MALTIVSVVCIFTGFFYNDSLGFVHEISGYLMVSLILIHLILHIQWIKSVTKSILSDQKKLITLVLTIVISIGVCASLFLHTPTNHQERDGFRRQLRNSQGLN